MLTLKRKVWPDKSDSDYFMACESYFQSFQSFLVFPSGSGCAWFSWVINAPYEYEWILNMELVITNVYIRTEKLKKSPPYFSSNLYKPLKRLNQDRILSYISFFPFSLLSKTWTHKHISCREPKQVIIVDRSSRGTKMEPFVQQNKICLHKIRGNAVKAITGGGENTRTHKEWPAKYLV